MKKLIVISTLVLSLMVGSSGCRTREVVKTRPEPAAVAVRPAPPRPDWFGQMVNGFGAVEDMFTRMVIGEPPRHGHVWVAGHWVEKRNGWYGKEAIGNSIS